MNRDTRLRWYKAGASNATTNVSRYTPSGSTHSSGIAAMSWLRWLVTAASCIEAPIGSRNHIQRCSLPTGPHAISAGGFTSVPVVASGELFMARSASQTDTAAYRRNAANQQFRCVASFICGSIKDGYIAKASSDAALDSAKSRYGTGSRI